MLGPEHYDKWWVAQSLTDATAIGDELAASIQKWGLPALKALSSPGALVQLWQTGVSPGLTAMERERCLKKLHQDA
jgi:hypothetical protein